MISRTLCSKGIFAEGVIHSGRIPTLSSDANSSRVSVFDSATMIRVWPLVPTLSDQCFEIRRCAAPLKHQQVE